MGQIATIGDNKPPKTLSQYALEIRQVLQEHEATDQEQKRRKIKIGSLLLEVKTKFFPVLVGFKGGAGVSKAKMSAVAAEFKSWCEENLKNREGKPFSHNVLRDYMRFARHASEGLLDAHMHNEAAKQKRIRDQSKKYERIIERAPALEALASNKALALDQQVNLLMTAWETAENAARRQFMSLAGLKFQ